MKKDRNAFFSDFGYSNFNQTNMMPGGNNQGVGPWNQTNMMTGGMPSGTMPGGSMPLPTDIDSRISKLERELKRLETRVSKLEGEYQPMPSNDDYGYNNSMYMV